MMLPANPTPPLPGGMPIRRPGPIATPMQQGPMGMRGPMQGRVLGTFKKGGKVKKTGKYLLHKGERVLRSKLSDLA
jgi:hypothetical protein